MDGATHRIRFVSLFQRKSSVTAGPSISSPAAMRGKAIIATDATVDNRSSAVRGEEGAEREGEGSEGAGPMSGAGIASRLLS